MPIEETKSVFFKGLKKNRDYIDSSDYIDTVENSILFDFFLQEKTKIGLADTKYLSFWLMAPFDMFLFFYENLKMLKFWLTQAFGLSLA
jgi:hypothetical protein